MDVFNIAASQASKAPEQGAAVPREGSSRSKSVASPASTEDVISVSATTAKVGQFVSSLSESSIGDVRTDFVQKFRALMNAGVLDSEASADRAASGLIDAV